MTPEAQREACEVQQWRGSAGQAEAVEAFLPLLAVAVPGVQCLEGPRSYHYGRDSCVYGAWFVF